MNRKPFKELLIETKVLFRSIPAMVVAAYVVAIIIMNLLANKAVPLPTDLVVVDCGIFLSWMVFLTMDIITMRFGPRAATIMSVVALLCNLFMCGLFFIISILPGYWSAAYDASGNIDEVINYALNGTFGGTWYVLFGSSIAFLTSAVVNNFTNYSIGKSMKKNKGKINFKVYAVRSYISTMVGQFVDNLVFALIVSHNFFGLSLLQCVLCAFTGAILELITEVIFSPLGYKIINIWEKENVGAEYREKYFLPNQAKKA